MQRASVALWALAAPLVARSAAANPAFRSGGLRDFVIGKGQRGLRMEAVQRAHQLPPEHLEAMERTALAAANVEAEPAPIRIRVARIVAQHVEMCVPFGAAVVGPNRLRQRRVERV